MHEELVLVVNDNVEKKSDRSISSKSIVDLPYSIKGHFASSKAGHVAPMVIIIADDTGINQNCCFKVPKRNLKS